nr:hypothetical protein [Ktedonobacteraceae bacterium]
MQQTRVYKPAMFKGDARRQYEKDSKKLAKDGWRVHTLDTNGTGTDQIHTSILTVVYEK